MILLSSCDCRTYDSDLLCFGAVKHRCPFCLTSTVFSTNRLSSISIKIESSMLSSVVYIQPDGRQAGKLFNTQPLVTFKKHHYNITTSTITSATLFANDELCTIDRNCSSYHTFGRLRLISLRRIFTKLIVNFRSFSSGLPHYQCSDDYSYGRAFGRHAMLDPRSTMPRNGRPKTSIMNLALVCQKQKYYTMQVTYHAANLPIYRNIYHEMKINLPLCCCCCCFLTYIYAALRRYKQHG